MLLNDMADSSSLNSGSKLQKNREEKVTHEEGKSLWNILFVLRNIKSLPYQQACERFEDNPSSLLTSRKSALTHRLSIFFTVHILSCQNVSPNFTRSILFPSNSSSIFICSGDGRKLSQDCKIGVWVSLSADWEPPTGPTISEQIRLRYGIVPTRMCLCACVYVCGVCMFVCEWVYHFKMHYISLSYSSVDNWFGEIVLSVCDSVVAFSLSLSCPLSLSTVCVCVFEQVCSVL